MKAHELTLEHFAQLYNEGGNQTFGASRVFMITPLALSQLRYDLIDTLGLDGARRSLSRMGRTMGMLAANDVPEELDDDVEVRRSVASIVRLLGIVESALPADVGSHEDPRMEIQWYGSVEQAAGSEKWKMGCCFTSGFVSGFLSGSLGRDVFFLETECVRSGSKKCIAHGGPIESWPDDLAREVMRHYGLEEERAFKSLEELEREQILRVVEHADSKRRAAEILGIGEATLYRKLKAYSES